MLLSTASCPPILIAREEGTVAVEEAVDFPSQEEALALHARLLDAGDPVAPSDLAVAYLEPLARSLRRTDPRADEDDRATAAEDALLDLIRRPDIYDSGRMSLEAFLRMAARRDLQNLQRKARRHADRRADWGDVELSPAQREHIADHDADPAAIVEMNETIETLARHRLALPPPVTDGLTEGEMAALQLIAEGERRTDAYAGVLGLQHLPPDERRAAVKRIKDKLKVRVKRGRDG
jgi:DNA-directed RNA polymerase specialized sigma24 family protein